MVTQAISAHVLPNGKLSGHVTVRVDDGPGPSPRPAGGDVTCVIVVGNNAFVTWTVERAGAGLPEGTIVVTHIVDGDAADPAGPDLIRNSFFPFIFEVEPPERQEGPCFVVPVIPPVPVIQGNYTVHDGPPVTMP